ncbi:protease m50 membrane-bound transcription factor site 2 protease [Anaeramoeba flamelloides]|uniref:Endopeptidase S2P n=1 Tax=Anaeramoeba flamelloides TaxID=1746091 RepID=A0ABQ8XGG6_9EUKA|nr:protease m50 membrane-bound transcription factor site 2 protease [Anaeramoeba flamelloides]
MNFFLLYLVLWVLSFITLRILYTYKGRKILSLLRSLNLTVSIFSVQWHSPRIRNYLNQFLIKRERLTKFLNKWFYVGIISSVIVMVLSTLLWIYNGIKVIRITLGFQEEDEQQLITPIIPGVNIPTSHIIYLVLALIFNGVFHELGHALASVSINLPIRKVGFFLAVFYPGGFVEVQKDIEKRSNKNKLKVFSAGIWHNIFIFFLSILLIIILPMVIKIFFISSNGSIIVSTKGNHELIQPFPIGDAIVEVNNCSVTNTWELFMCLKGLKVGKEENGTRHGRCASVGVLNDAIETSGLYCCEENGDFDVGDLKCLETIKSKHFLKQNMKKENKMKQESDNGNEKKQKMVLNNDNERETNDNNGKDNKSDQNDNMDIINICLSPKKILKNNVCMNNSQCLNSQNTDSFRETERCVFSIHEEENYFLRFQLSSGKTSNYFGNLKSFVDSLEFSNHYDRFGLWKILPSTMKIPSFFDFLIRYSLTLSGGLIVINVSPCYYTDGGYIIQTLIDIFIKRNTQKIKKIVLVAGTSILLLNIVLSLFTIIRQHI